MWVLNNLGNDKFETRLLFALLILPLQNKKKVRGSLAGAKDTPILKLACFVFQRISMEIFPYSFTLVPSLYIVFILQVELIAPSNKSRNRKHDAAFVVTS